MYLDIIYCKYIFIYILYMALCDYMNENILKELRSALMDKVSIGKLPAPVLERQSVANTWGTNSIEGNTLSFDEVEKVLVDGTSVSDHTVRDVLETVNHDRAFRALSSLIPKQINLVIVQELHEKVFKGVKEDAGQWRRSNVRIRSSRHTPPRWEKIVPMMTEWEKEYAAKESSDTDVFEVAAWMHQRFESIHPFSDGNGRVGRLLLNLHFMKHNWPPVNITLLEKDRYIDALEKGGGEGDLSILMEFLKVMMAQSLIDILDQVGLEKNDKLRRITELEGKAAYSAKYIALRANQGILPAIKRSGEWMTSSRAVALYGEFVGRE